MRRSVVCSMHLSFQHAFVLATLVCVVSSWQYPEKSDYTDHPCERDCLSSAGPRHCEYNFTVEHYQTLSRACFNCPSTNVDCSRPHCVPGDGARRAIKVVNRMMPGPALHVCLGDTLVVNVYNELHDFEGTSIHWHGVLQKGTQHMDGATMITQCPIPAHSMFQYRFKVAESGTHYWHAHAGLQRGDGVYGAIIVRDTQTAQNMRLYDYDLPEHTILVQDWFDQITSSKYALHHHGMGDNSPTSILINGRGRAVGSVAPKSTHNMHDMSNTEMSMNSSEMVQDTTTTEPMDDMDHSEDNLAFVPYHILRVTQTMSYRFRIISNGVLNCPLKVSVENHNITLIASDGYDMHPVDVESFIIFAGERYDFVLKANQAMGNYWLHVVGLGDCQTGKVSQSAILRYDGAMDMDPHTGNTYEDGDRLGMTANPFYHVDEFKLVSDMTSDHSTDSIFTAHSARKFYLEMDFNNVENDVFLHPDFYPLSAFSEMHTGAHNGHLYALQLNHITNTMPWSPLLSQHQEISQDKFCNESSVKTNCREEFCRCIHRIKVQLGEVVELVMISEGRNGMGNHPMHLHGHSFHVIGMQKVNSTITREDIEVMDQKGQLKRNLQNPVKKDTVMVPDGGYTIIRFNADNPGFWFFHCHVDFHLSLGLSMVIQVGETHEMNEIPRNFPKCGNWKFVDGDCPQESDDCAGSAVILKNSATQFLLTVLVSVVLTYSLLFG